LTLTFKLNTRQCQDEPAHQISSIRYLGQKSPSSKVIHNVQTWAVTTISHSINQSID